MRPCDFVITTFLEVSCARLSFLPRSYTDEKILKVSSRKGSQRHMAIPQVIHSKMLREVLVLQEASLEVLLELDWCLGGFSHTGKASAFALNALVCP